MSAPRLPGFTFLQHLGTGGFADVYLYEQQVPRQRVAVKVVRPDIPLTDTERALFTAEADAMAALGDHPHIVSVLTAGVADGRPYLVMRYCPPPDLGVRVRDNPMGTGEALSVGIKIASAVHTAHRAGIVHRDIKPGNVLITAYSEPALTDFGISGRINEVAGQSDVRISYPWSPPELLDGRSNGSVASDVYSLGATIWHLLVGRSPFAQPHGDNSTGALSARILHTPAAPTHRTDVPPSLERLLARCLAKQPELRPTSALDLARELQRVEAEAGFGRTSITAEATPTTPGGPVGAPAPPGGGATELRPVSVVSASSERPDRRADQSQSRSRPRSRPGPSPRARTAWLTAALVAVVVVAALLVWRVASGGGTTDPPAPTPTAFTPAPLSSDLPPPVIAGTREGEQVAFRWRASDGTQDGDTFLWNRTDSAEGDRTEAPSITLDAPDGVCVQVTLIRGSRQSAPEQLCVD